MYDGIAGFVTQPIDGAKKEGVAGLIKGFGKGIGGLMLKPSAGKLCVFGKPKNSVNLFSSCLGSPWIHIQRHL